jgi:hypothetical protein
MTEPTTSTAAAGLAASLSGVTMALIGVEWYALFWSLIGALFVMGESPSMGRGRAVLWVVLTMLIGAALAHGFVAAFDLKNRAILIGFSAVFGAGAQRVVSALIRAAESKIDKFGGDK